MLGGRGREGQACLGWGGIGDGAREEEGLELGWSGLQDALEGGGYGWWIVGLRGEKERGLGMPAEG